MFQSAEVLSHWHTLIDNYNTSALDFYKAVEESINERQVPEVVTSRVDWHEGGVLSAKREYLRVTRRHLTFDICAAPYGTGYFFSTWLTVRPPDLAVLYAWLILGSLPFVVSLFIAVFGFIKGSFIFLLSLLGGALLVRRLIQAGAVAWEDTILAMPVIGFLYRIIFRPTTYYSTDTRLMFQESVHRAVVEVIEGLRTAQGLRALSPEETKLTMQEIFR